MAFKPINNFEKYKKDFVKDTKLKVEENMSLYIQYYHARVMDDYSQVSLLYLDRIQVCVFSTGVKCK